MSWVQRVLSARFSPEVFDVRFGQFACFAAGPALLVVALYGLAEHALTPSEALIGVLASVSVALQLITLGLLLPLTHKGGS
jgi:hypothetical protein